MDEAFAGLTGYRRIVDDIVIYDSDEAQHTDHVRQFLHWCSERKITLNTEKWLFAKTEVNFAGFHLSAAGYRVDDSITEAILKFPIPTSRSDLRSFVGLVNQLSSRTPTVAGLLAPLRPLLSTKNDFMWSPSLTVAFDDVNGASHQHLPSLSSIPVGLHACARTLVGEAWALSCSNSQMTPGS